MSQDQWMLLVLKGVLIIAVLSIAIFIGQYHRLTRGGWLRDSIGVTLMAKDVLLLGLLGVSTAAVFFNFNRLDSRVAAWIQIAMLGLVSVCMVWRIVAFQKESNKGRGPGRHHSSRSRNRPPADSSGQAGRPGGQDGLVH